MSKTISNTKLTAIGIAVILMLIFVLQNMQVVAIDFLFWQIQASRVIIYLSIFLLGILTGWLGKSLRRWRH